MLAENRITRERERENLHTFTATKTIEIVLYKIKETQGFELHRNEAKEFGNNSFLAKNGHDALHIIGSSIFESLGGKYSVQGSIWNEMIPNRLFIPISKTVQEDWQDIATEDGILKLILWSELANKLGYYKSKSKLSDDEKQYWKSIFKNNIISDKNSQKILFEVLSELDSNYELNLKLLLKAYSLITRLGEILNNEQPTFCQKTEEHYLAIKNWQPDPLGLFKDLNKLESIKTSIYEFLSVHRKSEKSFNFNDLVLILQDFNLPLDFNFFLRFKQFGVSYLKSEDQYFVSLPERDSFILAILLALFPEKLEQLSESNVSKFVMQYEIPNDMYSSENTNSIVSEINHIFRQLPQFYTTHNF